MFNTISFYSFLLTFLCLLGHAQNTFVPDDNFEQVLIDLGLDSGPLDDFVLSTNINGITTLNIEGRNISDLTGIEGFTILEELNCKNNQLTNIDISNNINLTQLFLEDNLLTNLDVTNNTLLQILWCFNNQLSNLNVTQNPNLISLRCENNLLSNLDITQNINLNVLTCENNQISTLDVSDNTTLNRLQCGSNLLSVLDVTNNLDLSYISCESNQIPSLDFSQNNSLLTLICFNNLLSTLDLSQNNSLTTLNCSDNMLCSLNVRNGNNTNLNDMDFSLNPDLNCVIVDAPNTINANWLPLNFLTYATSPDECNSMIPVDELNDFIGGSYTLPPLTNGLYFSKPNGMGTQLFQGDTITTSQTIYIFNNTLCFSNETNFNVTIFDGDYFIPKYFTPNNDSNHDTWKVLDNTGAFTSIHIFNKYGKLLKHLTPNAFEWDGTFRGKLMQTDDYWYVIYRENNIPIKGHFTLKR